MRESESQEAHIPPAGVGAPGTAVARAGARTLEVDCAKHGHQNGWTGTTAIPSPTPTDLTILRELDRLAKEDDEYWDFRCRAGRHRAHRLSQYPAMMVPTMQAVLMDVVTRADQRITVVVDPFAGSGTTLVECMRLGLDYVGQDINPLAVLLCRTKAGPFHTKKLAASVKAVLENATRDRGRRAEADFPGIEKWFCPKAVVELSRIRRAIRAIDHAWSRRVLWTGLAETVRLTSNSRTSTFKLHVRDPDDLRSRTVKPLTTFRVIIQDITRRLCEEATTLKEAGHVSSNGWYRGDVVLRIRDTAKQAPRAGRSHDLLITSPPYGDNTTTVPYGQYSYLPLQWIDLSDIDEHADPSCLQSTHEIDSQSLGGSRRHAIRDAQELLTISPSLEQTLQRLEDLPVDRAQRVAAFCRDLDAALCQLVGAFKPNTYMIWTVGNRRVGGELVPTDAILSELLASKSVHLLQMIPRKIPNKRMATKNSVASTMRRENILLFRKA